MKTTLRLEEAGMFLLSLALVATLDYSWGLFALLFFLPDISMLGYVKDARTGAFCYNLFHHKGLAVLIGLAGYFSAADPLLFTGLLLFSHASFDRIFGYGLKFPDNFHHTHLGPIGKTR